MTTKKYRESVLNLTDTVGLTKDAKEKLKELKKRKKQSMAQIVINLINTEYDSLPRNNTKGGEEV